MDFKVSGSGNIPDGEYENIRVSGSARLGENVKCLSLHASGSVKGGSVDSENDIHVSGAAAFSGNIICSSLSVSGASDFSGSITASGEAKFAGSMKCGGKIKCSSLKIAGSGSVSGDIEGENVCSYGALNCGGLLNAENIQIIVGRNMEINSIGGGTVTVKLDAKNSGGAVRLAERLVRAVFNPSPENSKDRGAMLNVPAGIEGDTVTLEHVKSPQVSGRRVVIGDGCIIELVQYSESVEISENASVGRYEKI